MKLKPIFDRVVVTLKQTEQVTASGLVLPSSSDSAPVVGKVVAVGDGLNIDGQKTQMLVQPGDEIVFSKYAGVTYKADGEEYLILRQTDILAVIEK